MRVFFDSAIVAKLYCTEADSAAAAALVRARPVGQPLTLLHELEVENVLRVKVKRGEVTRAESNRGVTQFAADIRAGLWIRVDLEWPQMLAEARQLSANATAASGCRTLDLLHVATAKVLDVDEFVSRDERQLSAARVAGLRVTEFKA